MAVDCAAIPSRAGAKTLLGERKLSREVLLDREKMLWQAILAWQGRWILGLAVANGAALAAVAGSMLSDLGAAEVSVMLPSAWMFAVGLLGAGALPAIDLVKVHALREEVAEHIAHLDARSDHEVTESVGLGLNWKEWAIELLPALAFAGGVIYPLVVLSTRYLTTGVFGVT